ncbi:flagellar hook protein FlgE [Modestobacter sp. URMC 112]
MLRSMFSAISGLRAHQTKLDVSGNNIANVNTVGFKGSQTVFEDTLSQVLRNGSAPTGDAAGSNPAQVGLGVKVAGITTNFSQGAQQNTGRSTDFMIQGDGFFVTRAGNENLYTRAGSFDFDGAGNLVTPDGAMLQGWMADGGVVSANGPIGPLKVPFGQVLAPSATTGGGMVGNLSADAAIGTSLQFQAEMYDSLGNPHMVNYQLTKTAVTAAGVTTWQARVLDADGTPMPTSTATPPATSVNVVFDADGVMTSPTATGTPPVKQFAFYPPAADFPSWDGPVTIDITSITQFGGKSSVAATRTAASGSALGTLESFALSNDGTITGVFSNGLRQPIGQLALATFANPGGLEKAGNTSFRMADNSGAPAIGLAGAGGRGTLSAGALEMSNVDLAEEFTGLIVAQRGFQANSRVITTSDELLQDLVQLKR